MNKTLKEYKNFQQFNGFFDYNNRHNVKIKVSENLKSSTRKLSD